MRLIRWLVRYILNKGFMFELYFQFKIQLPISFNCYTLYIFFFIIFFFYYFYFILLLYYLVYIYTKCIYLYIILIHMSISYEFLVNFKTQVNNSIQNIERSKSPRTAWLHLYIVRPVSIVFQWRGIRLRYFQEVIFLWISCCGAC